MVQSILGVRLSPACSPPGANAPAKLKVTEAKFIKFLPDVQGSSTMLARASVLRSSHPLWNASAQNEVGCANFRRIAPEIGYHSNVHSAIAKRRSYWSCPPIPVCILTTWWRSVQYILRKSVSKGTVKIKKVASAKHAPHGSANYMRRKHTKSGRAR